MGNTLFSQKADQQKIPSDIAKKAKKIFSESMLPTDSNISGVGTDEKDGSAFIVVGLIDMDKSTLPSHVLYTCPKTGKSYSVPLEKTKRGRAFAYNMS